MERRRSTSWPRSASPGSAWGRPSPWSPTPPYGVTLRSCSPAEPMTRSPTGSPTPSSTGCFGTAGRPRTGGRAVPGEPRGAHPAKDMLGACPVAGTRARPRGGRGHPWPGRATSARDLGAVAAPQGVERAVAVDAAVGVRAEEVALSLRERGRKPFGPQRVVVGQRGGEPGGGHAELGGGGDHAPPAVLRGADRGGEVVVGEQRRKARVAVVGRADPVEEAGPDDAAAAPDRRHGA